LDGQLRLSAALPALRSAAVIAIPIADPERLTGLTELNDALALGKPVVMTRTPHLPFDLDATGVGITVGLGDEQGWVSALNTLADADFRQQMGARARRFADEEFNYEIFSRELTAMCLDLVAGRP
jgi:glycosyltransferase involved in cell wall biosynthesis